MTIAHSPRIVTSGLIYANDAGNTKSYSGVGTAIKNLVGYGATNTTFNQTFVSSGTTSYFESTGSSSYISNTNVSVSASTGRGFTICMMVKPQTLTNSEWNYWFQQQSGTKAIEFGRYGTSGGWEIKDNTKIEGQKVFTDVGTTTWTVPVGVTTITAVCVGGGGGAGGSSSSSRAGGGGGGGGLSYGSTISVTPGDVLYIRVGAGGIGGTSYLSSPATSPTDGTSGESSYIKTGSHSGTLVLEGGGGGGGKSGTTISNEGSGGSVGGYARTGPAGSFQGHGGDGGRSTTSASGSPSNVAGGGGGAGGYPSSGAPAEPANAYGGSGGGGVSGNSAIIATVGGGGGGGGGGYSSTQNGEVTNPGGGVGIFGRGSDGTAGTPSNQGGGGSGGDSGTVSTGNFSYQRSVGGLYGGGGGSVRPATSDANVRDGGNGGQGAVRIVWGTSRSYPTTNTSDPIPVRQSTSFSDWTFVVFGVTTNYYTFVSTNGSTKTLGSSNDWSTAPQINLSKIFGTGTSNYDCLWNNVMIYDRELTNEEIQINFEAYRRKFNL
jgi:hypothetical protein